MTLQQRPQPAPYVSIRAPVKGAMLRANIETAARKRFNPRPREGSDSSA